MRIQIAAILVLFFCHGSIDIFAQEHHVTVERYEELLEESGIKKTKKALRPKDKYYPEPTELPEIQEQPPISFFGAFIMKMFAYALLILMIGLVLYLILSNIKSDKSIDKNVTALYEADIEDIDDVDTDSGYNAALAAGNYRLAIRMRFIRCLQLLADKEHIFWEKEKTNRNYFREIKEQDIKTDFREIATIFERWWYSEEVLDVNQFRTHDQRYLAFINRVK